MASTSRTPEESSSSPNPPRNYDVFLSFRGEDTRKNFTDHLFSALLRHGFSVFRDNKLERGEEIGPQLLKTIEDSRASIIVFSRNYANSRWCLDELVKIMECKNSITLKQRIVPVFYDIDPSDVRAQRGSFADAFAKHEERYRGRGMEDKVEKWRAALTDAANLSGWDLQNVADGHESKFIDNIVNDISSKLNLTYLNVVDYPVGLESRVQDVTMLLSLGSDNICIVGIWGIGGVGKTTIAKAIYNQICGEFEGSCFLANIRETSKQHNGLVQLQEHLLFEILKDENQRIRVVDRGTEVIKQRAWSRRVFVVLDDVDNSYQLKALGIRRDWLHSGSIIIVTTRDKSLLELLDVDEVYMPELLSYHESLQLFSRHAFGEYYPLKGYVKLSREVVGHAGGLPLALEVLGSSLFHKTVAEWKSVLKKLKVIPDNAIQEKLRISFDSLADDEKDVFLDIVCFFVEMDKNYIVSILDGCGFFTENAIGVLHRRCLIGLNDSNHLTMHDLIRDMGRDIARRQYPILPRKGIRLWFHNDVVDVLTNDKGKKAVEGIVLDLPSSNAVQLNAQVFTEMKRLRLLKLHYVHLSGSYKLYLSKELRWLYWFGFPLQSIPSNLSMEKVVAIDLSYSSLKQVWKGKKILNQLKFLRLSHSYHLTKTPDFSGCTNLEELWLNDCMRLVKVHQSVKCLDKLVVLSLKNCESLRKLPIWMKSVQTLDLSGCSKLGMFSGCQGLASKSWFSHFSFRASLVKNPDLISFRSTSIQGLVSIRELDLADSNLSYIPDELGSLMSLKYLHLEGNNFCTLPASISHLSRLSILNVLNCTRLQSLPELPINILSVLALDCVSLERISLGSDFRKLPVFDFSDCHKLVENSFANIGKILRQELVTHCGFTFSFSASEVPDYVKYQSVGSVLSLVVLDQKIRGWTLYFVLESCFIDTLPPNASVRNFLKYRVKNKTKGVKYFHNLKWSGFPIGSQNQLLIHQIPQNYFKLETEVGDEVECSICTYSYCLVKKWGIDLIYEDNEKEYCLSNDRLAMIQYVPPSYPDAILDEDVSTDQAMADNNDQSGERDPCVCLWTPVWYCYRHIFALVNKWFN